MLSLDSSNLLPPISASTGISWSKQKRKRKVEISGWVRGGNTRIVTITVVMVVVVVVVMVVVVVVVIPYFEGRYQAIKHTAKVLYRK